MKRYDLTQIMNYAHQLYASVNAEYRTIATFAECLRESWLRYKCTTMYKIEVTRENGTKSVYHIMNEREAYRMFRTLAGLNLNHIMFAKGKFYEKKVNATDRRTLYFDIMGDEITDAGVTMTLVHYNTQTTTTDIAYQAERTYLRNYEQREIGRLTGNNWQGLYGAATIKAWKSCAYK